MTVRVVPHVDPLPPERKRAVAERLAEAVRARRGKLDYRRAAEEIGIPHPALWRIENHDGELPKLSVLVALLDWTGADPAYVLGGVRRACCENAMAEAREEAAQSLALLAHRLRGQGQEKRRSA